MMTMMMTTNFSEIKKQGRNKGFEISGVGKKSGFLARMFTNNLEIDKNVTPVQHGPRQIPVALQMTLIDLIK